MIFVTGGAGFIGSNFVLNWLEREEGSVVNLDKLTYAGNLANLESLERNERHIFVRGDIQDRLLVRELLGQYHPSAIIHFAAETHVDKSIYTPSPFIQTNVVGTFDLLEEALVFWKNLNSTEQNKFKFIHISTDEVYGSLDPKAPSSLETSPYAPNSPYAASKAGSDHLIRAYYHTYGLPTIITHASNNFGPYQFPEKLIPLLIFNAIEGKPLPIYGDGLNIRNWLYVEDHCNALRAIIQSGLAGEVYNIGGVKELTNNELVFTLCGILDDFFPKSPHRPYSSLIQYVEDRPGHDRRYSINSRKILTDLGWQPQYEFEASLRKTVEWYLSHTAWVNNIRSEEYKKWIDLHYAKKGNK